MQFISICYRICDHQLIRSCPISLSLSSLRLLQCHLCVVSFVCLLVSSLCLCLALTPFPSHSLSLSALCCPLYFLIVVVTILMTPIHGHFRDYITDAELFFHICWSLWLISECFFIYFCIYTDQKDQSKKNWTTSVWHLKLYIDSSCNQAISSFAQAALTYIFLGLNTCSQSRLEVRISFTMNLYMSLQHGLHCTL